MQSRDEIRSYLKQVAKEEGLDDAMTLAEIDNWNKQIIESILDSKIQKYLKELKNISPASIKGQDLNGKIASLEEVKSKLVQ